MDSLTEQIFKALSEKHGWPLDFAEGFLKGKHARASNDRISLYSNIAIDNYSNGFRAGYYDRRATLGSESWQNAA